MKRLSGQIRTLTNSVIAKAGAREVMMAGVMIDCEASERTPSKPRRHIGFPEPAIANPDHA
jgi:hypothetical protein